MAPRRQHAHALHAHHHGAPALSPQLVEPAYAPTCYMRATADPRMVKMQKHDRLMLTDLFSPTHRLHRVLGRQHWRSLL